MILLPSVILTMPDGDNKEYMTWLYEEYHRLMYSVAWKYFSNPSDVDDVVSSSCLALMKKIDTLRGLEDSPLQYYIVTAVKNTALNALDKQKRLSQKVIHPSPEVMDHIASVDDMQAKIEINEELALVRAVIDTLPEKERLIMKMKFFHKLPDDVIAKKVGLSVHSIAKYVSRAREHIRKKIYLTK